MSQVFTEKWNPKGIISLILGALLVFLGYHLFSVNSVHASICNSALGQLGQSVNQQASSMCASARHGEYLGAALFVGGLVTLYANRKSGIFRHVPKEAGGKQ